MKLATALLERANIQRNLSELETRLSNNARVQEGERPAEDPKFLIAEMDENLEQLGKLIARINLTNSQTMCDGMTITEMLAKRDTLGLRIKIMRDFLDEASSLGSRYSRTEIKLESTVSVSELRKEVDAASKELRLLDEKIQETNWTSELL